MITDERLMRYATAIARDDINYIIGTDYPLPASDHDFWRIWKRVAAVVIKLADEEHPPPPGSTQEQIPEDILALIVRRSYFSTACETARSLQSAAVRHPERADQLALWRDRMHDRCRLNNKFTGAPCRCGCHTEVT